MKEIGIKDAVGGSVNFYPDLPRKKAEELIASKFWVLDGRIIDDWDGTWGTSSFALLKAELESGEQVTFLCGGKAVVRQVSRMLKRGMLPGSRVKCVLNMIDGPVGSYYLLDEAKEEEVKEEEEQPAEVAAQ